MSYSSDLFNELQKRKLNLKGNTISNTRKASSKDDAPSNDIGVELEKIRQSTSVSDKAIARALLLSNIADEERFLWEDDEEDIAPVRTTTSSRLTDSGVSPPKTATALLGRDTKPKLTDSYMSFVSQDPATKGSLALTPYKGMSMGDQTAYVKQQFLAGEDKDYAKIDSLLTMLKAKKDAALKDGGYTASAEAAELQGYYNELVILKQADILSKTKMDDSDKSVLQELEEITKLSGDEKDKRKEAVLKKFDELGFQREDYALFTGDSNLTWGGFGNWLRWSAEAGAASFFDGLASTLNITVGEIADLIVGDGNYFDDMKTFYESEYANAKFNQQLYAERLGGGSGWNFAGDVVETSVAMLPDILMAIATSGGSAAGSVAGSTAKAGGSVAAKSLAQRAAWEGTSSILTKASITASNVAKNPQFWTSFARTYGNDYEQAVASGASEEVALFGATLTSLVNSYIEVGATGTSGFQGLPDALKSGDKSKILAFVESSLAEGGEEGLQRLVNELTTVSMYDHDADILNPEEYARDMALGTTVGLIAGGGQSTILSTANAIGKHQANKLTTNEQAVVDKIVKDEIAKKEENGKKLTGKEKKEILDETLKKMERGYISTDVIESVLGGEDYKAYKETVDSETALVEQEKALTEEYNALNKKVWRDMTGEEHDRLDELKTLLPELRAKIKANEESGNSKYLYMLI